MSAPIDSASIIEPRNQMTLDDRLTALRRLSKPLEFARSCRQAEQGKDKSKQASHSSPFLFGSVRAKPCSV